MSSTKIAPNYSVWKHQKTGSLITILGKAKVLKGEECIIVGSESKGVVTLTPEQLIKTFKKL